MDPVYTTPAAFQFPASTYPALQHGEYQQPISLQQNMVAPQLPVPQQQLPSPVVSEPVLVAQQQQQLNAAYGATQGAPPAGVPFKEEPKKDCCCSCFKITCCILFPLTIVILVPLFCIIGCAIGPEIQKMREGQHEYNMELHKKNMDIIKQNNLRAAIH